MKYLLALFIFMALSLRAEETRRPLLVAVIDWCPQICLDGPKRGYIIDIFDQFVRSEKISIQYMHLPWSRGINDVKRGKMDVLLSPSEIEGKGLILPQEEIGIQQMCFFGRKDFFWKYEGPSSIQGNLLIAVAQDASLVELAAYAAKNPKYFNFQPIMDHSTLVQRILKKQGDLFIYTRKSTLNYIQENHLEEQIEEKGCLTAEKLFVGVSPSDKNWAKKFAGRFSLFMKKSHRDGAIKKIMHKYGFEDWK